MICSIPPHTDAIDVEPSEAMTSEFTRTVYGKSLSGGSTASNAFSARVPAQWYKIKSYNSSVHFASSKKLNQDMVPPRPQPCLKYTKSSTFHALLEVPQAAVCYFILKCRLF